MQTMVANAHDCGIRRMRHVEAAGVAYDGHGGGRGVRDSAAEVRKHEERGLVRLDSIRSAHVMPERTDGKQAGMASSPASDVGTRAAPGRHRRAECCRGFASTRWSAPSPRPCRSHCSFSSSSCLGH